MSKISNNPLVQGARGNFGKKYVYKKRGNDTHLARMPEINKNAVVTEKQEKVRELFASAALYAQGAMSSPDLKAQYKKKAKPGKTAYNVAFRDYVKAPVVKSIDPEKYNGTIGSTIVVSAKDDFRVVEVAVTIRNAGGVIVEQGNAVLNPINRNQWIYTATQLHAAIAGSVIAATAKDIPGNTGALEVTV